MASIRSSAETMGSSFPAVSRFARYLTGMRKERTSGMPLSTPIAPASAADWIGDKGGTYQTIGKVRYSGCSGKAIFQSIAIFHPGGFVRSEERRVGKEGGSTGRSREAPVN